MSSLNLHRNAAHVGSCVHFEVGAERRGMFLVATSPAAASEWVVDLRSLASFVE